MAVTYNDSAANVKTLCDAIPGLPAATAKAWLRCEGQSVSNPTNPLNILFYNTRSQIGSKGRFATYASTKAGLEDAAWLINKSSYYQGVRNALAKVNGLSDVDAAILVARAIEESPWAGGHYGGAGAQDGCIVRQVRAMQGQPPTEPKPKPKPQPDTEDTYTVKPGDSLWAIAERFYHDGSKWRQIYDANKKVIGSNPSLIRPGQKLTIP